MHGYANMHGKPFSNTGSYQQGANQQHQHSPGASGSGAYQQHQHSPGASGSGAYQQHQHSPGASGPGAQGYQQPYDGQNQGQYYSDALQFFRGRPEYMLWLRHNQQRVDFVIRSYLHVAFGQPAPHGFTPPMSQGYQTPPPGGSSHSQDGSPGQGGSWPPPPPHQPHPPGRRSGYQQGMRGTFENEKDEENSGSQHNTRRSLFSKRKRSLMGELWKWFRSWFTEATGTTEFVDEKMRSARETLKPALSLYDKIKERNKAFWEFIGEYEETNNLIIVPLDFVKANWVYGFVALAFLFMMSYVVHVINAFPNYMQAMKMFWLVFMCSGMNYFKCKTRTMLLSGMLVSGILTYVPFDSYTELPDSKLCPCRVYQAMDICMKVRTNKFVMEGWPLLDQVLRHCSVDRDGNMCKHLLKMSERHAHYFYECLHERVILDPNVIEQRAIAIPEYDTENGQHTYVIKQFSEISDSPELSVYALMNRMEIGHYLITNDMLSKYVDIIAQTGEKSLSYWRYIPILIPSAAPVFTWLNLLVDFFGVKNGPITRKSVLKALDYMTGISEEEKIELMKMANGNLSSTSDIFYHPPYTPDETLKRVIKPTKGSFYVFNKKINFDKYPKQGLADDNIKLKPRCTNESTLDNLIWNLDPECLLGAYCREAINAHVTDHDTRLCPEKCAQKAFDSGCTAEIEKSTENEGRYLEQLRDCTHQLSESKSTVEILEKKLESESKYCKYEEGFHKSKRESSEQDSDEDSQSETHSNNYEERRKNRYKKRFSTFRDKFYKEQKESENNNGKNSDKKSGKPKDPLHEHYKKREAKILSQFNIWDYTWMLEYFTLLKITCGAVPTIFLSCACCCALCMMKKEKDETKTGVPSTRPNVLPHRPAGISRGSGSATTSQSAAASGQRPQTRSFLLELADGVSKLSDGLSWVTTPEMQLSFETDFFAGKSRDEIKKWVANGKGPARVSQRIAAQKPRTYFGFF